MKVKASINELKNEIELIRKRYPAFKNDSAFVFWFLHAHLTGKENTAQNALTGKEGGRGGEKNIDAIFIDRGAKQCNIIQGKFHTSESFSEKRNDVLSFADLGLLPWAHKTVLETFYSKLDPIALEKFKDTVSCVKNKSYGLNLYYVTTGKCSDTVINEADSIVRQAEGKVNIFVITNRHILSIYQNFLDDITPHIPSLKLRVISEGVIQHEGLIYRFDPKRKIESWIISVCGQEIGDMYAKVGKRLFAKNIRGWLGSNTDINESIAETIKKEPYNFWYYNNGITIVCDDAKREAKGGQDAIIIEGAQIINGQQTTRTLCNSDSQDTNVLVKIIKIPREFENNGEYDELVNSIVRSTNWQNSISPSDLVSNDYIQVYLEREFRKCGYQYIRKKMSKTEARTLYGQGFYQIDKKEIAQAIAACLFDPLIVRKGKERLFEDPYYKSIFGSTRLSFYLSKYWLMKQVQYAARGYPQRAYAKWLVLNFAWKEVGGYIGSGYSEKRFRHACEHYLYSEVLNHLLKAITDVFRAAIKYYRLNRGEGEEARDISTFFQLSKLDSEFKRHWNSNKNPYRSKVKNYFKKFKGALEKMQIEE
jgi:hypothetical protein